MKHLQTILPLFLIFLLCKVRSQAPSQLERAENIVEAVNQKDADLYVENFTKDVKVYMYNEHQDFELRIDGLEALHQNRTEHFRKYPEVRNEIQHLAEIDHRVIMHDKVWLLPSVAKGSDIVEIFTFHANGKISRVDVIQQRNLFSE